MFSGSGEKKQKAWKMAKKGVVAINVSLAKNPASSYLANS